MLTAALIYFIVSCSVMVHKQAKLMPLEDKYIEARSVAQFLDDYPNHPLAKWLREDAHKKIVELGPQLEREQFLAIGTSVLWPIAAVVSSAELLYKGVGSCVDKVTHTNSNMTNDHLLTYNPDKIREEEGRR